MRRSAGGVRSQTSVAGLVSRDRRIIASCILLIGALAWAYLIRLDHQMASSPASQTMMGKMEMTLDASWGARDLLFTFGMWAVMMVGMMTAAAAPVLLLFTEMQTRRDEGGAPIMAMLFGLGYVAVWVGFSAAAALAQWGLHQGLWLSSSMALTSSPLAGAILIGAGAYQLTPAKGTCLRRCQSPLGFLLGNWREGGKGALQMGIRHGAYCLGCCWALMFVLFVVGVMNLAWVAALTAFILAEKFGRGGARVARVGGLVMIGFGAFILAT
jgi:predicted metal-binding membrane protein